MNRHHPYGSPGRRGNNSPGPDRGHRYSERGGPPGRGRGGFSRGRGGYGNFEQNMSGHSYDQGAHQADYGGYNSYELPPPSGQQSYYQNNYGDTTSSFPPDPQSAGYNQAYPKYEDGPGTYNDEDRNRRPFRKDRDDKVHDSIIEERIQRERPCRTLFIRNIKYETPSEEVRRIFEEHGEIKTFFDLISTRGMVFVTYYDLRAAERARERLQGSEISGRPIDVHYSLPRDDQKGNDREKNQQFQGVLQVTLRNSASGQLIDDNEVRRKFQAYGDIKSIKAVGDRLDSRYVEFYDIRVCTEAHDHLKHQPLQDGTMDIVFSWDESMSGGHNRDGKDWEDRSIRGGGRGRGRGRGGRGRDDDDDRRGHDYGRRDRDYGNRGRYDDDRGGRGQGGYSGGGGAGDRYWNNNNRSYGGPPPPPSGGGGGGGYGGPIPPVGYGGGGGYGGPPAPPSAGPPGDDRLEQARKVQQLLAALKQPAASPTPPAVTAPPAIPPSLASMPPAANPYYPPPPTAYPPSAAANPYPGAPSAPASTPVAPSATPLNNPALANLPPNILALLQSAQQQRPLGAPAQAYPGMSPHMMAGQLSAPVPGGPPASNTPQYQQLMAYLQSQATAQAIGKQ